MPRTAYSVSKFHRSSWELATIAPHRSMRTSVFRMLAVLFSVLGTSLFFNVAIQSQREAVDAADKWKTSAIELQRSLDRQAAENSEVRNSAAVTSERLAALESQAALQRDSSAAQSTATAARLAEADQHIATLAGSRAQLEDARLVMQQTMQNHDALAKRTLSCLLLEPATARSRCPLTEAEATFGPLTSAGR